MSKLFYKLIINFFIVFYIILGIGILLPSKSFASASNGKIAFWNNEYVGGNNYIYKIYSINPDGTGNVLLYQSSLAAEPDWSPDGTKIIFWKYDFDLDVSQIYQMNSDGSGLTQLTHFINHEDAESPVWSPDGTKIAFMSSGDLYIINSNGTNQVKILDWNLMGVHDLNWSPDGERIVFAGYNTFNDDYQVYTVNIDGSGLNQLTNYYDNTGYLDYNQNKNNRNPAWSPDGTKIAFSHNFNIYVMNPNGDEKTFITPGVQPIWSPDGTKIAYNNAGRQMSIINPDGTQQYVIPGAGGVVSSWQSIDNLPAIINPITSTSINEGSMYLESGSFTDSDSSSWAATVDYGDGLSVNVLPLNTDKTFNFNHVYKDNGIYTVNVNITDNQGAIATVNTVITVNNVNPTVGTITATSNPVQVNNSTNLTTSFTDPGSLDTHTASWDWGDGTITNGTLIESNGSGSVSDNHTYALAGVYQVSITVADNDGGVGTQVFQYVSVYNPTSQGLFSAGQKYTSPSGAYIQNPNITGNVKFGLSYKYQGAIPTGNRQFTMDFNQANLNFNATTIDSLVINNGIGSITGTGTINGSGSYNFLVTGSENTNTIRIQIKDQTGNTIYDTQPGDPATATPKTLLTGNVLAH